MVWDAIKWGSKWGLVPFAIMLWGWLTAIPGPFLFLLFLLTLGVTLFVINQIQARRNKQQQNQIGFSSSEWWDLIRGSLISLALFAGIFLTVAFLHTEPAPSTNSGVPLPVGGFSYLTHWGMGKEKYTAAATIDTRPLIAVRNAYYLLLLCRWEDNSVDAFSDTNILKSQEFSITGEDTAIEMKMPKRFADSYRDRLHYYLLLIPRGVPLSDIANIQGALGRGGLILTHAAASPILEGATGGLYPSAPLTTP